MAFDSNKRYTEEMRQGWIEQDSYSDDGERSHERDVEKEDLAKLDSLFDQLGEHQWIDPKKITVSHWVRMKCMFGCPSYGKVGSCPPNVPSIEEAREFVYEYKRAVLFHFTKKVDNPEERKDWSLMTMRKLMEVERRVFLMGYFKAFLLNMDECRLCEDCPGQRSACNFPKMARPSMESMGVDVFTTVRDFGFPIQVLDDYDKEMNRFALLLIE